MVLLLALKMTCKYLYTDHQDGVAAATAADYLHGDGGECDISYYPHETYKRRPCPTSCDTCVCFHVCQPTCTFPCLKVSTV